MIDGVKIFYYIPDLDSWRHETKIEFHSLTDLSSGSVKTKIRERGETISKTVRHEGNFETFRLTVSESEKRNFLTGKEFKTVNVEINGSIHKNHFAGQNYDPFHWDQLQYEIGRFCESLKLDEDKAVIQNLEFGVNISVPFRPYEFLTENLISYKGEPFNKYNSDSNGKCLGYVCKMAQYSIKIYDKGLQYELFPADSPNGLMRFEVRYVKMQQLNRAGIKTLADLRNVEKVGQLKTVLMRSWNHVLIFDPAVNVKSIGLKDRKDRDLLKDGQNPKYWQKLKKDADRNVFDYQRDKFKRLIKKYGGNLHESLGNKIEKEWQDLFKNSGNLPGAGEDAIKTKFREFTLKINGNIPEKRFCKWCGLDITDQKKGSRFCGPKFRAGKEVNRCRDKFRRAREKVNRGRAKRQLFLFCES